MNIHTKAFDHKKIDTDVLIVFAWPGVKDTETIFASEAAEIETAMSGLIKSIAMAEGFIAEAGKTFMLHTYGKLTANRILVVGVGSLNTLTVAKLQSAMATAAKRTRSGKAKKMAILLSSEVAGVLGWEQVPQAIVEGVILGNYQFTHHKTVGLDKMQPIEDCTLLTATNKLGQVARSASIGEIVSKGVIMARDLVNEPPSLTTPTYLADVARSIAKKSTSITCEVFGKPEIAKMGMGGLLSIARGSDEEPKFIKLSYKGGGRKTVAIIGKGITFDTGGLSLKPAGSMETMKLDMAGAASILGVFSALSELKPKVNVVGLIPATENMPGPNAVKPGDIVKIMNGKTVEILNTDAEGRMVLSDALSYAVSKVKPDIMIDVATLTGACVVALGEEVAGLFASHQPLADDLLRSANVAGESIWQLPLVDEYRELMKGNVSDLKNIGGGRWGGAITAALFLQEFVSPSIPWAHLDIAGPAFAEKELPVSPKGGTGFIVRTLLSYLREV